MAVFARRRGRLGARDDGHPAWVTLVVTRPTVPAEPVARAVAVAEARHTRVRLVVVAHRWGESVRRGLAAIFAGEWVEPEQERAHAAELASDVLRRIPGHIPVDVCIVYGCYGVAIGRHVARRDAALVVSDRPPLWAPRSRWVLRLGHH